MAVDSLSVLGSVSHLAPLPWPGLSHDPLVSQPSSEADHPVAPGGTRNEPSIAVDPTDPDHVLVLAHSWSRTGNNPFWRPEVEAYLSRDGGQTFDSPFVMPRPAGTNYGVDPATTFDARGRAYAAYIASAWQGGGIFVMHSDDGSWESPPTHVVASAASDKGCVLPDKEYITSGPPPETHEKTRRVNVYLAWQNVHYANWDGTSCNGLEPRHPIMMARSFDRGRSFSKPIKVSKGYGFVPMPAVDRRGRLYIVYLSRGSSDCDPNNYSVGLNLAKSLDGGLSFSRSRLTDFCVVSGLPGSYGTNPAPTLAIDPNGPSVSIAYPFGEGRQAKIAIWTTSGYRRPWKQITAIEMPPQSLQFPWLSYGPRHEIFLFYMSQTAAGTYDAYIQRSLDHGKSWTEPLRLTTQSSIGVRDYTFCCFGIAHYMGMAVGNDGVAHPVWTDLRNASSPDGSSQNVWTRRVFFSEYE